MDYYIKLLSILNDIGTQCHEQQGVDIFIGNRESVLEVLRTVLVIISFYRPDQAILPSARGVVEYT